MVESAWYQRSLKPPDDPRAEYVARMLRAVYVAADQRDLTVLEAAARRADNFVLKHGNGRRAVLVEVAGQLRAAVPPALSTLPRSTRKTLDAMISGLATRLPDRSLRLHLHYWFVGQIPGTRIHRELMRAGVDIEWTRMAEKVDRAWQRLFRAHDRQQEPLDAKQFVVAAVKTMGIKKDLLSADRKNTSRAAKRRLKDAKRRRL